MPDTQDWAEPGSASAGLLKKIDRRRLPRHVAVIMDGNGRWADSRRMPRVAGHRAGSASVREIIETSAQLGIEILTLYAFSVENWKRPRAEVRTLWGLLREYLRRELKNIREANIRFQAIGRLHELPPSVQKELQRAVEKTRDNTGMLLNVALNYSGRAELVDTFNSLLAERGRNGHVQPIDEAAIAGHLYTAGLPDPDLLIRTSGEMRISNFLLWQIAYAEIYITPVYWPDFRSTHLLESIVEYQKRERRYGGIRTQEAGA